MDDDRFRTRWATTDDADAVAGLLHDFNEEFDTPTPGTAVLAARLRHLLPAAGDATHGTLAVIAGDPPVALALLTLRTNVWYDGRVALLDELYVRPHLRSRGVGARIIGELLDRAAPLGIDRIEINVDEGDTDAIRFYTRHGFTCGEPGATERELYLARDLAPVAAPDPVAEDGTDRA